MNKFILLAIGIVFFSSCTIKKTTITPSFSPKNAVEIIERAGSKNNNFQWLSLKGRASIIKKNHNIALGINIKNRKDSIIWISARGPFGVEIIRAKLTPDSICVINRITKTYLKKPASEIKKVLNSELSFNEIQDIISGTLKVFKQNYSLEEKETGFCLNSDNRSYYIANSYRVKSAKRIEKNSVFEISLDDFGEEGLPRKLVLKLESEESFEASINYTKIEINKPQKILFEVPESYNEIK